MKTFFSHGSVLLLLICLFLFYAECTDIRQQVANGLSKKVHAYHQHLKQAQFHPSRILTSSSALEHSERDLARHKNTLGTSQHQLDSGGEMSNIECAQPNKVYLNITF